LNGWPATIFGCAWSDHRVRTFNELTGSPLVVSEEGTGVIQSVPDLLGSLGCAIVLGSHLFINYKFIFDNFNKQWPTD